MAKDFEDGVWRTIGGRRVFIKTGQSLSDAMKESGKFKKSEKIEKTPGQKTMDLIKENNIKTFADEIKMTKDDLKKELDSLYKEPREDEIKKDLKDIKDEREKKELTKKGLTDDEIKKGYKDVNEALKDKKESESTKTNGEKESTNEKFEVSDLKKKAMETLPKSDIDSHDSDLYIKKTPESTKLLENMKDKDSGLLTTFKDQQTGETWYDVPFANMEDDYKEKTSKSTNDIMNKAIREKASKKDNFKEDLPKKVEIKEQGTSNRKEVSENLQAHILEYYDSPQDFVEQMDAMKSPTMWKAGEEIAKGGSYLIYNGDMSDFLDELKINPKGKKFSDDKAFDMYTSLVGRESAKLYDRIQKNSYNKYMKEHPLSKMSFEEFKDMNKKK